MSQAEHSQSDTPAPADDGQVVAILKEYLANLEAGECPNRKRFEALHPELADYLDDYLFGLEYIQAAGKALRSSPAAEDHAQGERSGITLGDFRVLRQVGRGGMGIVYEAVQISLHRRVALKV